MSNSIKRIPLGKLVEHPDNPNRMSKSNLAKLLRNIERTGKYEPLVVRKCKGREGFFEIINGHHRRKVLAKLGHTTADAVVWDINDEEADILLLTLNRLGGTDVIGRKRELLKRLNERMKTEMVGKFLPQTAGQIRKLIDLNLPKKPLSVEGKSFAKAVVFFLDESQQEIVEEALGLADVAEERRGAVRRASAIKRIAEEFINQVKKNS